MTRRYSAVSPIAHALLRILILLNWIYGAGILVLLAFTFVDPAWTMRALGLSSFPDPRGVLTALRGIALLGLAAVPLHFAILSRLLAIVGTVRAGDAFVPANADRLETIGWALLVLQLLSLAVAGIAEAISTPGHPLELDAGFSLAGWLAILLAFILARVFAEGTLMREDLEATV